MKLFIAAWLCTAIIVAIFYFSKERINSYNSELNNEMEEQVDKLSADDSDIRRGHFDTIVSATIKLSDLEARNVGLVGVVTLLLTAFTAYALVVLEQKSEGDVVAALTYVVLLTRSFIFLPYTYQEFLRTLEISNRLVSKKTNL